MMASNSTESNERVELVNDEGEVIGTELRSVAYQQHRKNIRIVEIFLMNSNKEIYLLQRASDRPIAPGAYECCAEHVHPGESDIAAAQRGVEEELGLAVDPGQFIFLGYTTPADGAWGFSAVFLITGDYDPKVGNEHQRGEWKTRNEIMTMLRNNPHQFRSNTLIHFSKYANQLFE